MALQRSPKPLTGVRFPHRLPTFDLLALTHYVLYNESLHAQGLK